MPHGSHTAPGAARRRSLVGRLATFTAGVGAGLLFLASHTTANGNEIRAASVTDLRTLVQRQKTDTDRVVDEANKMAEEVRRLSKGQGGAEGAKLEQQIAESRPPAGLTEVTGTGITVTLSDAPADSVKQALNDGSTPVDRLVVHQQDIQAVINALWVGGARAVSVQDVRVISTTGIKCVGNTVILHGVPYSPPYRIAAVGDPLRLQAALDSSDYLAAYRQTADRYGLGYAVSSAYGLTIPKFEGIVKLRYAQPLKPR